jgi:spore maturation protein CgeB
MVAAPGPGWSVHDVYIGWCEGLAALGETVCRYPLGDVALFYAEQVRALVNDRLAAALWKTRPDVLLSVSTFYLDPQFLDHARRAYGTKVVLLHTESPYEEGRQLALAPHADMALLNDPTHLGRYREHGPAHYIPHAYRPSLHHPGSGPRTTDFSFVGTGWPSRQEFFAGMDLSGLAVELAGAWMMLPEESPLRRYVTHDPDTCLDNEQTADLYRRAKTSLNLYRREAESPDQVAGWSMGPREVELAACGTFFLRDPRPEGDELLHMLPTFGGPGEASELLRWWLAHDDEREAAAEKARLAIEGRTFEAHAAQLLRLITK